MGLLSDHLYAEVRDHFVSVHARIKLNSDLLDMSGGQTVYELCIDGNVADTHAHGTWPKGGSMFTLIELPNGQKLSLRVDVQLRYFGLFGTRYTLIVDGEEIPLTKTSEAKVKELLHRKSLGE